MSSSINSECETYAVCVAGITSHENALIQGVLFGDTLSNGINGVPFNAIPFQVVGLEDLFRDILDLFRGGGLSRVEVWVGGRGNLDIETNHVVFAGNNHDRAGIGVDSALGLYYLVNK